MLEKQTKPPGRYTESSLLGAMETAGRTIDDEELREAMKESGLGTPATRADTIERLLNVGYIDRDGKALTSTPKGRKTIELLGTHALTSAELTGSWEKRLSEIEHAQADRSAFMADIASFTDEIVEYFRTLRTESLGDLPQRRRRDPREPGGLRLLVLQEQVRAGLRLHHLEEPGRLHDHPRGGGRAAGLGPRAARWRRRRWCWTTRSTR